MFKVDKRVAKAIGIVQADCDVSIPLYTQKKMSYFDDNGVRLGRACSLPLSTQALVSLVLQIYDVERFKR